MADKPEKLLLDVQVPVDFPYNYRIGQLMEKYIEGLGEKKILGVTCPQCSKVTVPPRTICGACNRTLDELVEVGPSGTVENFTVGHVTVDKGLVEKLAEPRLLAMVKLDGATVPILAEVKGIGSAELVKGLRVGAVFSDPPEDGVGDLSHFEPEG